MFENYAEVLRLISFAGGKVDGRKKLQKMVYLAQQLGWRFTEDFKYHLYGPFSEQLANEIEEMKAFGFVTENRRVGRYSCSLTQQGEALIDKYPDSSGSAWFKSFVADLNKHDARTLELMATVLFLVKCRYSENQILDAIKTLKPEQKYLNGEIRKVLSYLSEKGFLQATT